MEQNSFAKTKSLINLRMEHTVFGERELKLKSNSINELFTGEIRTGALRQQCLDAVLMIGETCIT